MSPPGRLLAAIFDLSPDAIALNRARDGVFVLVNEGFARLTGWTVRETQGRTLEEVDIFRDGGDRQAVTAALRRDGAVRNAEVRFRRRSGEERVGLLSSNLVRFGPEGALVLSVLRDITEFASARRDRALLEAQLRQAQKMDALGRLVGGVAHDFNNLLTVMASATEAARQQPADPGRIREALAEIEEAGRRAAALTSQLLAFGRRRPLSVRPVDLGKLVEEMRRLLRRVIGEEVVIAVEVAPGLPPALADPNQLEQVILNLALNARDAMEGGGRLTIAAAPALPGEIPGGSPPGSPFLRLTVSDTGTGIAPEVRAHLFEPFFTTKPQGKGTGLGLATVRGIVQQSGGFIAVRSEPGKGASFDVFLPGAGPQEPAPPPEEVAVPTGAGETIVLVEDDPLVRNVARRTLHRLGYRVLAARDGGEGLDLLRAAGERVDLLVTDVVMPGMSGPELASLARGVRPGLPVLFVSGYPQPVPGAEEGSIIAKPFTAESLALRVRQAIRQGRC